MRESVSVPQSFWTACHTEDGHGVVSGDEGREEGRHGAGTDGASDGGEWGTQGRCIGGGHRVGVTGRAAHHVEVRELRVLRQEW